MEGFTLIDENGIPYLSNTPGTLGGYSRGQIKIYGRLDCPSARRWIEKGYYTTYRVFFADEDTAIKAGFRPCAVCLPEEYKKWKESQPRRVLTKEY